MSHFQTRVGSGLLEAGDPGITAPNQPRGDDRYFAVDSSGWIEPKQSRVFTCSAGGELSVEPSAGDPSYGESSTNEPASDALIDR